MFFKIPPVILTILIITLLGVVLILITYKSKNDPKLTGFRKAIAVLGDELAHALIIAAVIILIVDLRSDSHIKLSIKTALKENSLLYGLQGRQAEHKLISEDFIDDVVRYFNYEVVAHLTLSKDSGYVNYNWTNTYTVINISEENYEWKFIPTVWSMSKQNPKADFGLVSVKNSLTGKELIDSTEFAKLKKYYPNERKTTLEEPMYLKLEPNIEYTVIMSHNIHDNLTGFSTHQVAHVTETMEILLTYDKEAFKIDYFNLAKASNEEWQVPKANPLVKGDNSDGKVKLNKILYPHQGILINWEKIEDK
ncbi:MAG: hypothetical protein JJE09_07090 [Bacteroidia bacterium]|nr:hypothetical protein [Bacteroidia bacterium]